MAIQWGDWEYSGGNGMRVGLEVTWGTTFHSDTHVDATVDIWTENQYAYSDSQTLTYSGGSISGTTSFTNSQGAGVQTKRATKTYTYNYPSNSYGTSPSTRTFAASLSGAFNGITPSVSKNHNVPARPYAAPAAPTSQGVTRISDAQQNISWVNNATAGEPWNNVGMAQSVNGGGFAIVTSSISGAASSYAAATSANAKYQFEVRSMNSISNSAWAVTPVILTTPSAPTSASRSGLNGANQVISWTNTAGYGATTDWATEILRSDDNAAYAVIATVNGNAGTNNQYTDTYPATHAAVKFKYCVRHKTLTGNQGTLYSATSNETTQTSGTTTPPLAPTNLAPNGTTVDPTVNQNLTWTFQPGQVGDTQTKYQVRHRLNGSSTWTTTSLTTSGTSSYTLPANTYSSGQSVEWQVSTSGADPTQGPFSASAVFQCTSASAKRPITMDIYTGDWEAQANLALVPTGSIVMWPTSTPPIGWLVCDGSTFSASTYPALNTLLGGNTLPNFKQRIPLGVGDNTGLAGTGASVLAVGGSIDVLSHSHTHAHGFTTFHVSAGGTASAVPENGGNSVVQGPTSGRIEHPVSTTGTVMANDATAAGTASDSTGVNLYPPWLAVNYIIRT